MHWFLLIKFDQWLSAEPEALSLVDLIIDVTSNFYSNRTKLTF